MHAAEPQGAADGQWPAIHLAPLPGLVCGAEDRDELHSAGQAVQNSHVESFNGRLRDECLNVSWFRNLFEARRKISLWQQDYNTVRPHSSLDYRTPDEFAALWQRPSSLANSIPQPEPPVKAALAAHSRAALTGEPGCRATN